ncbi:rhamnan synthesis F family protein [Kineothrix sp. MB12-C1]|uniref:rhamnan synthesis F family protein n=1 Tax=Kineothrix sp. MB12-C1 TaxID=3070215 RepID=UPI0027D2668E|nr:rhamnan synthesis F family protein [Kineothrix sp. MB12-C1]WMC91706.1 rhamnan synthesis F family protein [Kineothrix sp. MB12-C1]
MNGKRWLIYYVTTTNQQLEKYSSYFIKCMKEYIDDVLIISKYNKDIEAAIVDSSISNAWDAYKRGFEVLGWDNLNNVDFVLCATDNIMGPVCNINNMMDAMSKKKLGCWSLSKQNPTPMNYLDYSGENLQEEYLCADFIVFEKKILQNKCLSTIFDKLELVKDENHSWIDNKALVFSKELRKKHIELGAFIDSDDLTNLYYNPLLYNPKDMIKYKYSPFFLQESFIGSYEGAVSNSLGDGAGELLDYLSQFTDYDIDLIWDSILKCGNQQDIHHNLHLNYILKKNESNIKKTESILEEKKVALIMHLYFMDLLETSYQYAQSMPDKTDLYITTSSELKKEQILLQFSNSKWNYIEVRVIENRGRDVSSLLVGVKDIIDKYDYACFVHDKKSAQLTPGSIGNDFGIQCFENTIGSKDFVNNIICTLYDNPRLGMLSPVYPLHGNYFAVYGHADWGNNYDITRNLADKLKLAIPISADKTPICPLGTMFWFKVPALKRLYDADWEYNDFPAEPNGVDGTLLHAVERIYSLVAQEEGYYPAIVLNEKYSNIMLTNLFTFLHGLNLSIEDYLGYCSYNQAIYVIEKMKYDNRQLQNRITELESSNRLLILVRELKQLAKSLMKHKK